MFGQHSAEVAICCLGVQYACSQGGLLLVLAVHIAGSMARRICWGLYPLSLKTVVRNSSSWVSESWSQRALALCIREVRTDCFLAGW